MTIIDGVYQYFWDCPLLMEYIINVDYLPADAAGGVKMSIDGAPSVETQVPHLRGGGMCQFQFFLRSVHAYGDDRWQNLANSGFYDDLAAWMRQQSRKRLLPQMPDGMQPIRIQALTSNYLAEAGASESKYQIQCQLDYYRKGA